MPLKGAILAENAHTDFKGINCFFKVNKKNVAPVICPFLTCFFNLLRVRARIFLLSLLVNKIGEKRGYIVDNGICLV